MFRLNSFARGINNVDITQSAGKSTAMNGQIIKSRESLGSGWLEELVNVNIKNDGSVKRRGGYTKIQTGNMDSLYSYNNLLYYRENNTLNIWNEGSIGQVSGVCSYYGIGNDLYVTDTQNVYVLQNGRDKKIIGIENKTEWSVDSTSGNLLKGLHLIAVTSVDDINESNAVISEVNVEQGGIVIRLSADDHDRNIYISSLGGEVLYKVAQVDSLSQNVYIREYGTGKQLDSTDNIIPVGGEHITIFGNSLYVATEKFIEYSEPYQYTTFKKNGYHVLDSNIVFMGHNRGKVLYIGTERAIYRMYNQVDGKSIERIAEIGGIRNSYVNIGNSELEKNLGIVALFLTKQGLCVILTDGSVQNASVGVYKYEADNAVPLYQKIEGEERVIFNLQKQE